MVSFENMSEYNQESFSDIDWSERAGRNIRFYNCSFSNCDFSDCAWNECLFRECQFENCNLSLMAVSNCEFYETKFVRCKMLGINFSELREQKVKLSRPFDFIECGINHCVFFGLYLRSMQMEHCSAKNADFKEADMENSSFKGTDFSEAQFGQTNLKNCDFREARNYYMQTKYNEIKGSKFQLPEAMSLLYGMEIEVS